MNCAYCYRSSMVGKKMGITFHCFPTNDAIKQLWIKACASHKCFLSLEEVKAKTRLCSDHFTPDDFDKVSKRLKRGSVPTRFSRKPYMHCIACRAIHDKDSGTSLFEFPEDINTKKLWRDACAKNGLNNIRITPEHAICSNHFSKDCLDISKNGRINLKMNAAPSIFPCMRIETLEIEKNVLETQHLSENISQEHIVSGSEHSDLFIENVASNIISSEAGDHGCERRMEFSADALRQSPPRKRKKMWKSSRVGDVIEDHFSTLRKAKKNFHIISEKCKEYQRKLNNNRTQIWKLKQRIKKLESLVSHLSEKNIISGDLNVEWLNTEEIIDAENNAVFI